MNFQIKWNMAIPYEGDGEAYDRAGVSVNSSSPVAPFANFSRSSEQPGLLLLCFQQIGGLP